ncbi:MAG: amidohydrolase family protein [Chthoniobacteraceae bacterium]
MDLQLDIFDRRDVHRGMKPPIVLVILLCFATLARGDSLVFSNATVIDVERGVALPKMSVVVSGDCIVAVDAAAKVRVPADAQTVDCSGKFLLPGLWDMHVHVLWEGADEFLPLCVANGITGIRDMHTMMKLDQVRALRTKIESGQRVGPRFLYAGPIIDGPQPFWPESISVKNADEARSAVRRLHGEGVDMIKVYEHLSRDAYFGIVAECRALGLPFGGHVPQTVTSLECADAGQLTIEHLSDVLPHCSDQPGEADIAPPDPNPERSARVQRALGSAIQGSPDKTLWPPYALGWFDYEAGRIWRQKMVARGELLRVELLREEARPAGERCLYRVHFSKEQMLMTFDFDPERKLTMASTNYVFNADKAAPVLERFRARNTWHCPTLTVHTTSYRDLDEALQDPHRRYVSTGILRKSKYEEMMAPPSSSGKKRFQQFLAVVKAMNDAGVGLLAGTDTPLGSIPGFGLHTELELMVRAGLKPAEALRTATLNPALCFHREKEFGTVATGKIADLLVLDADPLQDIRNTTHIWAVMTNGHFHDRAALDHLLAEREAAAKSR